MTLISARQDSEKFSLIPCPMDPEGLTKDPRHWAGFGNVDCPCCCTYNSSTQWSTHQSIRQIKAMDHFKLVKHLYPTPDQLVGLSPLLTFNEPEPVLETKVVKPGVRRLQRRGSV